MEYRVILVYKLYSFPSALVSMHGHGQLNIIC